MQASRIAAQVCRARCDRGFPREALPNPHALIDWRDHTRQRQARIVLKITGKSSRTMIAAIFVAALGSLQSQTVMAQAVHYDQGRYQEQLLDLSHILGKLHHLRGTCVSGEQQLWRDNMMELVRLENPPSARKNEMVAGFNDAYERARSQYPSCGRATSRAAVALAIEGEQLSDALAKNVAR